MEKSIFHLIHTVQRSPRDLLLQDPKREGKSSLLPVESIIISTDIQLYPQEAHHVHSSTGQFNSLFWQPLHSRTKCKLELFKINGPLKWFFPKEKSNIFSAMNSQSKGKKLLAALNSSLSLLLVTFCLIYFYFLKFFDGAHFSLHTNFQSFPPCGVTPNRIMSCAIMICSTNLVWWPQLKCKITGKGNCICYYLVKRGRFT